MIFEILKFTVFGVLGYLTVALGLVISQAPKPTVPDSGDGLNFSDVSAQDLSGLPTLQPYPTRSGTALNFRQYDSPHQPTSNRILILVHGSGWHGIQFHRIASALAAAGAATIIVPDLRGHGADPARRGDIDYIDQLEDDLADLISHVSTKDSEIVLAGHSSGGGLVLRFAGGKHGQLADRYIFMAPFLKHNAPTTRQNAGGWASPAVRRIIGLSMLNTIGVKFLNYLPAISFAMPASVLDGPLGHTATTTYSYRLNTGFAPHAKYQADIAALTRPFLLLVGNNDESFFADAYQKTFEAHTTSGTYSVLDDIDHLGIAVDDRAILTIENWL